MEILKPLFVMKFPTETHGNYFPPKYYINLKDKFYFFWKKLRIRIPNIIYEEANFHILFDL